MIRSMLLVLALIPSSVFTDAHAQTRVAFIGGNITYQWQSSGVFGASPQFTFEGYGSKINNSPGPCHETNQVLAVLQTIIAGGKRPVIHLMVGADDASDTSTSNPVAWQLQSFETCFANVVNTALQAKLKLVVGTNPYALVNSIDPYNKYIFAYCTAKGIPVIDYQTLLTHANNNFEGTEYLTTPVPGQSPSITNKGYAIMNSLADEVLSQTILGVTLKAGYLGNEALEMDGQLPLEPQQSVNTVYPGTEMHWQAYGEFSDGNTREIDNANVQHVYGTWTSSNPEVISIDPYGNAWALAPGTANIHFTTPSGATINEWIMYVDQFSNQSL
ncbi:MAG TPA: hypothetical protein VMB49_10775 [Acidobacteriaceae bacterium]|nr:hypothetical protein [Acidobacteriaceae bacterium]